MENIQTQTKIGKVAPTPYLGNLLTEFEVKSDGTKITKSQKSIIKELVDNHINANGYTLLRQNIFVSKYFVAVDIHYFPTNSKNTVFVDTRKTMWIGKRGGLKKFTVQTGLSKERNLIKIYDYYMKADEQ